MKQIEDYDLVGKTLFWGTFIKNKENRLDILYFKSIVKKVICDGFYRLDVDGKTYESIGDNDSHFFITSTSDKAIGFCLIGIFIYSFSLKELISELVSRYLALKSAHNTRLLLLFENTSNDYDYDGYPNVYILKDDENVLLTDIDVSEYIGDKLENNEDEDWLATI